MPDINPTMIAANNRGREDVGVYTTYKRLDDLLDIARCHERERIIALLEPYTHLKCEFDSDDCDDDFAYAIALIKGEQK